jgi:TonB family protein
VPQTSGPVESAQKATTEPTAELAGAGGRDAAQELSLGPLLAELRRQLEARKFYPRLARLRSLEGTVVLRATVSGEGRVDRWQVVTPSAHRILDEAALSTASQIRSLAAAGLTIDRPVAVTVPLEFRLQEGGRDL